MLKFSLESQPSGMTIVKKSVSVIPYDNHESLGPRTINTLGVIKPVRSTPPIRAFESSKRLETAAIIQEPLRTVLQKNGYDVDKISATGSAASGFSYSGSDLDITYSLAGLRYEELSAEYLLRDMEIGMLINEELVDLFRRFTFAVDILLNNSFQHPEYRRVLANL